MFVYSHLPQGDDETITQYLVRAKVPLERIHHTTKLADIVGLLLLLSYPCQDFDDHGEVSFFIYSIFVSLLHLSLSLATSTKSFSAFISNLVFILSNIFCLCLPLGFFQLSLPQQPSFQFLLLTAYA